MSAADPALRGGPTKPNTSKANASAVIMERLGEMSGRMEDLTDSVGKINTKLDEHGNLLSAYGQYLAILRDRLIDHPTPCPACPRNPEITLAIQAAFRAEREVEQEKAERQKQLEQEKTERLLLEKRMHFLELKDKAFWYVFGALVIGVLVAVATRWI